MSRPPRLVAWLLELVLSGEERDEILGDLHENYNYRLRTAGPIHARLWYLGQALSLPLWLWGDNGNTMINLSRQDVSYAIRGFLRAPAFTVITLLTLGVGIGANTAIFTVVDAVLLEPLPYPESDRLVDISHAAPGLDLPRLPSATGIYNIQRDRARTLESVALFGTRNPSLTGDGPPQRIRAGVVTPSIFKVLGVSPALGRAFTEEEGLPESESPVILSHDLWTDRFGADPQILGKTVDLSGVAHQVVGVMPPDFGFPTPDTELLMPLQVDPNSPNFGGFNFSSVARITPGTDVADVQRELRSLLPVIPERFPTMSLQMLENTGLTVNVQPLIDMVVGDVRTALWILLGTVGFVLLIACANVANLLLVRAESRQKEVAIRTAMGADRAHLFGQFLTESGILALAGGALGLLLAHQGVRVLLALGPENLPRMDEIGLDGSVLAFTAGISLVAAFVFGAIPVLRGRSDDTSAVLRDGYRGSTASKGGNRVRKLLVASQVAFALILLVGSGLMIRSFQQLRNVDPGFESENVLTFRLSLPGSSYPNDELSTFHEQLHERLAGIPGVETVGAVSFLPLEGMTSLDPLIVEGAGQSVEEVPPVVATRAATPGYFEALGIPLIKGRLLDRSDYGSRTVVLSQRVVDMFFEGEEALQRQVAQGLVQEHDPYSRVVGVVDDVHYQSLTQEPMGAVYYPAALNDSVRWHGLTRSMAYVVKTQVPPTSITPAVRRIVGELDPNLPLSQIRTMDQVTREAQAQMGFTMLMLGIAAGVGLLLGSVGLYGVVSYVTAQRTREIGVRIALGAEASAVRSLVMRQGLAVTGLGVLVGLAGSWGLSRFMESVLYEVSATDPLTFGSVTGVLLAVAVVATWVPAQRAAGTDPMNALRRE